MQSTEQWLPVVGHEGIYEVSDRGRVRSLDRLDVRGTKRKGRVLSPAPVTSGHLQLRLGGRPRNRQARVHVLVLEAFVGPRPSGQDACHNNGDPTDNRLSNLRWDTKSSNQLDRNAHGTCPQLNRTHCPRGHSLTEPNITARHSRIGKRGCWSCDRERSESRNQGRVFDPARADAWFDALASGWRPVPNSQRTHCPNGHPLSGENLRPSGIKRGERSCRACSSARSRASRAGAAFSIEQADEIYRALTAA